MINSGDIAGGAGGVSSLHATSVGAGVYVDGGSRVAGGGTISGGAAGAEGSVAGDAVMFGALAGTLVVTPHAVFGGAVVGNAAVDAVPVLGGRSQGTLSGLGTNVTGFTSIDETAGAHWVVIGSVSGIGSLTIGNGSSLSLEGGVRIASVVFGAGGGARWNLDVSGAVTSVFAGFGRGDGMDLVGVEAASLHYAQGTLTLFDAGHHLVDTADFSGKYVASDFALQAGRKGTAVLFAGTGDAGVLAFGAGFWHFSGR